MKSRLATGKLPAEFLASLLARIPRIDPRVVVGPGIGRDAAVIDMGDHYLVAKTDPITFANEDIGWYAVNVNANDVACMGARPKWFMATVLLPDGEANAPMAQTILDQITEACEFLQVTLVGGHTEITYDLKRPMVIGVMLGEVTKDKLVRSGGARVGETILLTKAVPLEGTALIAREKENEMRTRGFSDEFIRHAKKLLREPGISIVREALIASDSSLATAMHDPTEGGLATGLWELAQAANVGLSIEEDRIPYNALGVEACAAYNLDPLGVIASGSLLLTAPDENVGRLIHSMTDAGIACTAIGRVVPPTSGLILVRGGQPNPLARFETDEITRLFT